MKNALAPNFSSAANRNDDTLAKKWSGTPDPAWRDPGLDCSGDPGKTDPSGAKDADINNIVATYHKTGVLPLQQRAAVFADVSDAPSYQEALQVVIDAEKAFMTLPANIRKRFDNDATQMLAFIDNPENRQEAASLGMLKSAAPSPQPAGPASSGGQPAAPNGAPGAPLAPATPQS